MHTVYIYSQLHLTQLSWRARQRGTSHGLLFEISHHTWGQNRTPWPQVPRFMALGHKWSILWSVAMKGTFQTIRIIGTPNLLLVWGSLCLPQSHRNRLNTVRTLLLSTYIYVSVWSNPALTVDFVVLHCPSWARLPHCSFESHLQICLLLSLTVLSVERILLSFQSPQPATSHTNTRDVNTWCCYMHPPKHINKTTYMAH